MTLQLPIMIITWWSRDENSALVSWRAHLCLKASHMQYTTSSHLHGDESSSVSSLLSTHQLFIFFPLRCVIQCSLEGNCEFQYPEQFLLIIPPNDVWFQVCWDNVLGNVVIRAQVGWELHWEGKFLPDCELEYWGRCNLCDCICKDPGLLHDSTGGSQFASYHTMSGTCLLLSPEV